MRVGDEGGEIPGEASQGRERPLPGPAFHPDHKLAKRQMRGFGGMLAFDMKGGLAAARRFCDRVEVFLLAASLGGVESLVVLPIYNFPQQDVPGRAERGGSEPGNDPDVGGDRKFGRPDRGLRQALA